MTVDDVAGCPQCDKAAASGADFCSGCGRYLAWSDTPKHVATGNAHTAAPVVQIADPVLLFVTAGTVVFQQGAKPPLHVAAEPGTPITMTATLRNLSSRVNSYRLSVEGVPPDWVQIPAPTAHLLPVGPQGDFERTLAITITPPRSSSAAFGPRDITFRATPDSGHDIAVVPAVLDIAPFWTLTFAARPAIVHGRRRAVVRGEVRNDSNAPILPSVTAKTPDERVRITLGDSAAPIPPGQTGDVRIDLRAPPRLFGRPLDHELTLQATVTGAEAQTPPAVVLFRQRALVPWWVPTVLVTLAALAIALYAVVLANRKVRTPALRGASSAFVAQRLLQRQGFTEAVVVKTRVVASQASGTVLDQAPEAGMRVRPDTVVTIRVAVAPASTIIPDLRGTRLRTADGALNRAHLQLGAVVPSKNPSRRIVSQVPLPGSLRPRGTVVDLVVAGAGRVRVPPVRCLTVTQAERLLTHRGLKVLNLATITRPGRRVRVQLPAADELRPPGSAVQLVVDHAPKCSRAELEAAGVKPKEGASAKPTAKGEPVAATGTAPVRRPVLAGLTFDDGQAVRSATSGRVIGEGRRPAWSPAGLRLATVRAAGITVQSTTGGGAGVRARAESGAAIAAAFVPGRPARLLAFVTADRAGGALCLSRADGDVPDCLDLPGVTPRAISWGRDGHTLYVTAAPTQDPARPGLLVFVTPRPGSSATSDYRGGTRLIRPSIDGSTGSVFALAQRPHSDVVAIVTDLDSRGRSGRPQVAVVDAGSIASMTAAHWLGRHACEMAFDPSGTLLAVAAGRDPACPASPTVGRLTVVPMIAGLGPVTVTRRGASPAWRGGPGQP
ncbi:MAG: serine/threonine protein kinase with domain [Conexibacter sp.]|nr:serine/threonine protein kinase with domain [Solirubrobacterales bacterium]MCW3004795.1 serine/threonine protein kinase with domain [Conexibacter sp.]